MLHPSLRTLIHSSHLSHLFQSSFFIFVSHFHTLSILLYSSSPSYMALHSHSAISFLSSFRASSSIFVSHLHTPYSLFLTLHLPFILPVSLLSSSLFLPLRSRLHTSSSLFLTLRHMPRLATPAPYGVHGTILHSLHPLPHPFTIIATCT